MNNPTPVEPVFIIAQPLLPMSHRYASGNGATVDLGAAGATLTALLTVSSSARASVPYVRGSVADTPAVFQIEHSDDGVSFEPASPAFSNTIDPRSERRTLYSLKRYIRAAWSFESTITVYFSVLINAPIFP
ncbi:MAG: hypothetical protein IPM79_31590 [Polyangiaceae bacterium]|nr:hypothetical protein [Polyangiaceae bacterium]